MAKKKFISKTPTSGARKFKKFHHSLSVSKTKINNKTKIKLKNPKITSINEFSKFIYDTDTYQTYFSKTKNRNLIKLNNSELSFLQKKIEEIKESKYCFENFEVLEIPFNVFQRINSFQPNIQKEDEATTYIKNLIKTHANKGFISCRRISNQYFLDTGKKISKTKVHNIMKNKLNLSYLKTAIKTNKINEPNNKLISFCFIKIIMKCLKLNFKLIFVDESCIQCNNSNFKTWRARDETIYFNLGTNKKKNLIAAVDERNLLYYEINDDNTNEKIFLEFCKNLKNKIDENKIDKYVIILDNFSVHKTKLLKEYYQENHMNVLFISPYNSNFNSIELFFRLLKRKLYQKLFSSTDEVVEEIKKIIREDRFNEGLYQNYRETLEQYYKFSINNSYMNLNNINIYE